MKDSVPADAVGADAAYPETIGESAAIESVKEKIAKVSDKNVTVLIRGESGTGKELVARGIHFGSKRRDESFVHVNCAALPSELLESELFGYAKGAFTGATHNKAGRFEKANKGTIFLDEIGSLTVPLQAKILQVLEDETISRLGSVRETPIDVRILAATNSNLEEKIVQGAFRSDLFYRLNVISIVVPPLRERKEDIDLLVDYFMEKYCIELGKKRVPMGKDIRDHFQRYLWPGNIRELENIIRGIIALQKTDVVYSELKLAEGTGGAQGEELRSRVTILSQVWDDRKIKQLIKGKKDISLKTITKEYVAEVEKEAISKALDHTRWNRKRAAELLQISYKTLLNRIDEFDLA
jgi:transcriptional regulator with PAS, ATPase and Fis domain